jgi:hypothetical protein
MNNVGRTPKVIGKLKRAAYLPKAQIFKVKDLADEGPVLVPAAIAAVVHPGEVQL